MADAGLEGCRILVVEDEYFLADEIATDLREAGAVVVGPVADLDGALALIRGGSSLDGAILDVNLRGEMAFAAADLLIERAVPFVFTTGYENTAVPVRFDGIARCQKPIDLRRVARAIGRVLGH